MLKASMVLDDHQVDDGHHWNIANAVEICNDDNPRGTNCVRQLSSANWQ
jgi:hypothetical protein